MDDGEIEVSSSNFQASISSESFFDDSLRNSQTCSHTHTCNPPGPDAAHTHTCYHTHTRVIPSDEEKRPVCKARRPSGNREAVRKYREKKKAEAAHLEEEAKKLRVMNEVLMGKLQRQAFLEAEVVRLRSLVVGIRGRIGDELGDVVPPFEAEGECGNGLGRCGESRASWDGNCQPPTIPCEAKANYLQSAKK